MYVRGEFNRYFSIKFKILFHFFGSAKLCHLIYNSRSVNMHIFSSPESKAQYELL